MEMAARGAILSPFPKEEGEMCHACYPSEHRFLQPKGKKIEGREVEILKSKDITVTCLPICLTI